MSLWFWENYFISSLIFKIYFINESYALKIYTYERDVIENELNIMQMLDHPHLVKFFGEFLHPRNIKCLVIELCEVNYKQ